MQRKVGTKQRAAALLGARAHFQLDAPAGQSEAPSSCDCGGPLMARLSSLAQAHVPDQGAAPGEPAHTCVPRVGSALILLPDHPEWETH